MRLAVLGLGFMGSTHVAALRGLPDVELAAVYSSDQKKLAGDLTGVRGNLGTGGECMDFSRVRKYRDLEAVLADSRLDAVDLCLPTYLHDSVAVVPCARASTYSWKSPWRWTAYGVDRMIHAARRTNAYS